MISGARIKSEIAALNKIVGKTTDIKTVFSGGVLEASSAKGSISLPMVANNLWLNNTEAREIRGLADHESFHHAYTDLDMWREAAEYCAACKDQTSMRVWNGIEDPRIEAIGVEALPGSFNNLSATVDKWVEVITKGLDQVNDPMVLLPLKLAYVGRVHNGMDMDAPKALMDMFDKIGLDEEINTLSQIKDGKALLEGVANFMAGIGTHTLRNFLDGVPPPPQPPESGSTNGTAGTHDADLSVIMESYDVDMPYYGRDENIRVYKTSPSARGISDKYAGIGQQFAQALKSYLYSRKDAGRSGSRLDSKRLVSAYNGAENVWVKPKSRERGFNTALSFVMDHSGSMSNHVGELIEVTAALAKGVQGLKIAMEISGFTSWPFENGERINQEDHPAQYARIESLHIPMVKEFNEPFNAARLAGMNSEQMGLTPDSEALELAVNRISSRKEKRKIVIILTDGRPQLERSFVKSNGGMYLTEQLCLAHRKTVLNQAKEDGVEVYAIAFGHKNVAHFDEDKVLYLKNFSDGKIFRSFFKSLTNSAA